MELQQALANFTSPEPVVNFTIRLDPRGYLATSNAVLVSNVTEPESSGGVAGALKGLFGRKDKEEPQATVEGDEEVEENTEIADKEEGSGEADGQEEADKKADKKAKGKPKAEKVALRFREKQLGIKPMTGEEKRTTLARLILRALILGQTLIVLCRLTSIASYEKAKNAREEARNLLEGYLYRLSGFLSPEAENRALWDYGTEKERNIMQKLVTETFDWLSEHAEKAEEKILLEKRKALS